LIRLHQKNNTRIFVNGFKDKRSLSYRREQTNSTTYQTPRFSMIPDKKDDDYVVHYDKDPDTVRWLFLPDNKFKNAWDIYVILLLLYAAIIVPYRVCLVESSSFAMFCVDLFIDASFSIDIVLTFFTAIKIKDLIVTSRAQIAKSYFKGWFFIDLITTIPFQLLEGAEDEAQNSKALRLARLPRLYRLIRILRLLRVLKMLKIMTDSGNASSNALRKNMQVGQSIKKMFLIIVSILYITHIVSCFFFFMPKMLDFPYDSWVWAEDLIDAHHFQ
jgi:hyperpolarization activated cyclic nucleotide-gated potassium channel 2